VVVLAENDHLGADLLRRLDDRSARVSGRPDQLWLEPGRGKPLAGLSQLRDDLRRCGQRLAFIGGEVVQRSEVRGTSRSSGTFATLSTVIRPRESCASAIDRSSARLPPSEPS
jgi:hypothetical protein